KSQQRVQKFNTRMSTARSFSFPDNENILNAVGWTFAEPGKNRPPANSDAQYRNPPRDDTKLSQLINDQHGDTHIAQNTAYIACNGKVLKYHKIGAYREVCGEKGHSVVFAPGNHCGAFKVGNMRFALEICRDHELGVYTTLSSKEAVHIHII